MIKCFSRKPNGWLASNLWPSPVACGDWDWGLKWVLWWQQQQQQATSLDEGWRAQCTDAGMWSTVVGRAELGQEPTVCRQNSASLSPKTSSLPPLPPPCGSSGTPVALCALSSPGCWCFTQSLWCCLWCCCPPRIWRTALWMGLCLTFWPFLPSHHTSGPCAPTP